MTNTSPGQTLRHLIDTREYVMAPGAYDAFTASICKRAGFDALYLSGATLSISMGYPDLGLVTMTEVLERVEQIFTIAELPLIVDIDTGFGSALNVFRTVKSFEKAGAAAVHLEDQQFPKRCGFIEGIKVVSQEEMIGKIEAAVDARSNDDMMIIARCDAPSALGDEAAVERMNAYLEAGADMVFPQAFRDHDQKRFLGKGVDGLLMDSPHKGAPTATEADLKELSELGWKVFAFSMACMGIAGQAIREALDELREVGSDTTIREKMIHRDEMFDIVNHDSWTDLEDKYMQQV